MASTGIAARVEASVTVAPARHHHMIERPGRDAVLILMPAWAEAAGGYLGTKIVTVFPGNAAKAKPSVLGTYILMSGDTGEPLGVAVHADVTVTFVGVKRGFLQPGARRLTGDVRLVGIGVPRTLIESLGERIGE